ncbi:CO dehydrogenase/acetyl-CoA synthase complex subunit epsilon [[Eubacterium] cellulosolvens]
MAQAESWQRAEIPGPTKALLIQKPEVAAALMTKSKNPILISGSETPTIRLRQNHLIDYVARIQKALSTPIIATSNTVKAFDQKGVKNVTPMPAMEAAAKLSKLIGAEDPKAFSHDTAIFIGFPYYILWLMLSNLKHYALNLKTISLERYYQPHASWSFPNMTVEAWTDNLETLTQKIEG